MADSALKMLCGLAALPEFNVNIFSGAADIEAVGTALRTEPFMSDYRIVVLRDFSGKGKTLAPLFEGIPPRAVLAVAGAESSDAVKEARAAGEFVDCSPLDNNTLQKYIFRECPNITKAAVGFLIEFTGGLITRIKPELNKLTAYSDGGEINAEAVKLLVSRDAEYKIFEFSELLARRKADSALLALKALREENDDVRILSGVYTHFRRLLFAAVSKDGDAELAAQLAVKPGALKYIREQLRLYTPRKLKNITDYLNEADFAIKTGTAYAPEILNNAVLRILNS